MSSGSPSLCPQPGDLLSLLAGSTPPPRSLASWLTSRGLGRTQDETTACIPHDIYVIGTQENSLGDREWVEFLRASLKTLMAIDFRVVTWGTAWNTRKATGAERAKDTPSAASGSWLPATITPGPLPPNPGPSPTPEAAQGTSYALRMPCREHPLLGPPFRKGLADLASSPFPLCLAME